MTAAPATTAAVIIQAAITRREVLSPAWNPAGLFVWGAEGG